MTTTPALAQPRPPGPAHPSRRHALLATLAPALWGLAGTGCATDGPAARGHAAVDPALQRWIDGPQRSAAARARDGARHPGPTLAFFGLQAHHRVIELAPGGGWYTEILAPFVREQGQLVAAHYARDDATAYRRQSRAAFEAKLAADPALYGRVRTVDLPFGGRFAASGPQAVADGSVDLVLTFRNLHNWLEEDTLERIARACFSVLRPGGVFGVVDHRAATGTPIEQQRKSGYLTEALARERLGAAGFVLEATSEVNANPRDTRDHPDGVWSLPPTLRGREAGRERFLAIGESDRFTHRYRKPG